MAIKIPAKKIYGDIQHERLKKNRITEFSANLNLPTTTTQKITFSNEIKSISSTEYFEDVYDYAGQPGSSHNGIYTSGDFSFKQLYLKSAQIIKIEIPQELKYFQKSLGEVSETVYDFLSFYVNASVSIITRNNDNQTNGYSIKKTAFANIRLIENFTVGSDGFPIVPDTGKQEDEFIEFFGSEIGSIRVFKHEEYSNWQEYGFIGILGGINWGAGTKSYYDGIMSYDLSIKIKDIISFEEGTYTAKSTTDENGNALSIEGCPYFQSEAMAQTAAKNIFGEWGAGKEAVILSCAIDDYYDDAGNVSVNSNFAPNIFPVYEINGYGYDENLGEIYTIHGGTVYPSWENRQAEIFLERGYYSVNCFKRFETAKEYNDITFLTQSEILFQKKYSDDDWNGTFYIPEGGANVGIVVNLGYTPGGEDFYDYLKVYLYKGRNKPNIFVKPNAPMALQNGDIVVPYIMNSNRSEVPLSSNQSGKAKQYKVMGVEIDSTTLLQKLHLQEV